MNILKVFNLLIILEVKFKTFLNSDVFKNMNIKPPAPCPPKPEDVNAVQQKDRELSSEEIQRLESEKLKFDEMYEELPGPNTIPK